MVESYEAGLASDDGREAVGALQSQMGAKIVASAVFLDLGITDAITDKHRQYAPGFVVPIKPGAVPYAAAGEASARSSGRRDVYAQLEQLSDLRARGIITDAEFAAEKRRLLEDE